MKSIFLYYSFNFDKVCDLPIVKSFKNNQI